MLKRWPEVSALLHFKVQGNKIFLKVLMTLFCWDTSGIYVFISYVILFLSKYCRVWFEVQGLNSIRYDEDCSTGRGEQIQTDLKDYINHGFKRENLGPDW